MKLDVKVDGLDAVKARLAGMGKQVTYASAVALTRTVQELEKDAKAAIPSTFDRPRSQTVKGTYIKRATTQNLEAVLGIKDRVAQYLAPNIGTSGRRPRVYKRSEQMLRRAGILPADHYTVPGKEARLDEYGNMSRGQIVQILGYFRTFGNTALNSKRMNMTDKGRANLAKKNQDYFVVPVASKSMGLFPGIWQRNGHSDLVPVLMFVSRPQYKAIYNFYGDNERKAQRIFNKAFDLELANALRTAR